MESKRILYVASEITPYLPESPIGMLARELPQAIQEKGNEIRIFMPRYGCINERRCQLHEVIRLSGMNLVINDVDHPLIIKVASITAARMQVYFIDNEEYFKRKYTSRNKDGAFYGDNDERAMFFCQGVLETVKKLGWKPDIVHCHGWMSAFMPAYLKTLYKDDPLYSDAKVVYSVYNEDYFSEPLSKNLADKLIFDGLNPHDVEELLKPDYNSLNFFGMNFSDAVIKGSEKLTPELEAYWNTYSNPKLNYKTTEEYVDAYADFYDEVFLGEPAMVE